MTRLAHESAPASPPGEGVGRGALAALVAIALSALITGGLFAVVYVSIFGEPEPHDLPVAVVGVDARTVQSTAGDRYDIRGVEDIDTAGAQLSHREVYAVIHLDMAHRQVDLAYASAEGSSVLAFTQPIAQGISEATHLPLNLSNITPDVAANESPGRSLFFAAFGAALTGFIFSQALHSVSSTFGLSARIRLAMMAIVSVLAGLVVALVLGPWFHVLPQQVTQTWPVLSLLCLSIVAAGTALIDVLGQMGQIVAAILFTVLGNATSTGILPYEFLSGPLRIISRILPTGPVIRGLLGQAFFQGTGIRIAYDVPIAWILASVGVILVMAARRRQDGARATRSKIPQNNPDVTMARPVQEP